MLSILQGTVKKI